MLRAVPGKAPFHHAVGDAVWAATVNEANRDSVDLLVACLMPDHLHVLAKPRRASIIGWVNGFQSYTTHVAREAGGPPFLWQPRFYDRRIRDEREFEQTWFYIRRNPREAGLAGEDEQWPWVFEAERLA